MESVTQGGPVPRKRGSQAQGREAGAEGVAALGAGGGGRSGDRAAAPGSLPARLHHSWQGERAPPDRDPGRCGGLEKTSKTHLARNALSPPVSVSGSAASDAVTGSWDHCCPLPDGPSSHTDSLPPSGSRSHPPPALPLHGLPVPAGLPPPGTAWERGLTGPSFCVWLLSLGTASSQVVWVKAGVTRPSCVRLSGALSCGVTGACGSPAPRTPTHRGRCRSLSAGVCGTPGPTLGGVHPGVRLLGLAATWAWLWGPPTAPVQQPHPGAAVPTSSPALQSL